MNSPNPIPSEPMTASKIHGVLVEFHRNFKGAAKTGRNPHFNSDHFTLEDCTKAATPILNELGAYIMHSCKGGHVITAVVAEDGSFIESAIPLPQGNPQQLGSAITYFKRYNLCALLDIAEADDDGNMATQAPTDQIAMITENQKLSIKAAIQDGAMDPAFLKQKYGAVSLNSLTEAQAADAIHTTMLGLLAKGAEELADNATNGAGPTH